MNAPRKEDDYSLKSHEGQPQAFLGPMMEMLQIQDMYAPPSQPPIANSIAVSEPGLGQLGQHQMHNTQSQPHFSQPPWHIKNQAPEMQPPQNNFHFQNTQISLLVPQFPDSQLPRTLGFGYGMAYEQFPGEFDDRTNYNISSQERQGSDASITQKDSPKSVNFTKPRSKSAHNVIEQRYRNKINDKFQILQRAVPTLRVLAVQKKKYKEFEDSSEEDLDDDSVPVNANEVVDLEGLEPARKLNKGTILAKSIEYIRFLELKNDRLRSEHEALLTKAKMMGIE